MILFPKDTGCKALQVGNGGMVSFGAWRTNSRLRGNGRFSRSFSDWTVCTLAQRYHGLGGPSESGLVRLRGRNARPSPVRPIHRAEASVLASPPSCSVAIG